MPLSSRRIFFIFTNKLCISITKKKRNQKELFCPRELDTKTRVQLHFHEFNLLAFSVSCWRHVCASWLMNLPTTDCSPLLTHSTGKGSLRNSLAKPGEDAAPPGTPCTVAISVIQLCIPHHPTGHLPLCRGISSQYRQLSGAETAWAQEPRSRV